MSEEMITYDLEVLPGFNDGADRLEITVPLSWRVTISEGVNPQHSTHYGNSGGAVARFYEAKDKQRVMIRGVLSMRPKDVKVKRFAKEVFVESASEEGPKTSKHSSSRHEHELEF